MKQTIECFKVSDFLGLNEIDSHFASQPNPTSTSIRQIQLLTNKIPPSGTRTSVAKTCPDQSDIGNMVPIFVPFSFRSTTYIVGSVCDYKYSNTFTHTMVTHTYICACGDGKIMKHNNN